MSSATAPKNMDKYRMFIGINPFLIATHKKIKKKTKFRNIIKVISDIPQIKKNKPPQRPYVISKIG